MADPEEVTPEKGLIHSARIAEDCSASEEHRLPQTGQDTCVVQGGRKEEQKELEVQSEKSELLSQLNETKPEDTAAKLGKAPVLWSPLTVKAAVSKLSREQNAAKTRLPKPKVITQGERSHSLPRKTVAWSPLTVQESVNRLSAIQNDQLIQPRAFILVKHSVGNGFRSIIPPKQSKPPETQQVTPPVVERREIKVVQTGRHRRSKILKGPWHKVGDNLLRGRFKRVPNAIMKVPGFKDIMVEEVLKVLDKECETLTSLTFNSVLRENDPKDFRWEKVMKEWKTAAPTFLKFLQHASKVFENSTADQTYTPRGKSLPMAMGGALLLRARSSSMCAPMFMNSMILQKGGTTKSCLDQLNRVGVCMSHRRTQLELKDVFGETEETEEMDTTPYNSDEEKRGSAYEDGDSDVPEITYIVS